MSTSSKCPTLVTAALIYANGPIHIGHLAGCYLPADIYVRYLRLTGEEVLFVSGTDEHGVPITIKAQNEGITPQQVVDKYYSQIKKSFEQFGISFDIYSRTSHPEHHTISQDFFKHLYDKGAFEEITSAQYYDEEAAQFLADRYITGTCPVCGNPNAYGDQCEKCGSTLSPDELISPKSMLSGKAPVKKDTKNWYLPLDKLQPKLEAYIQSHPEWKTNVLGQCKSWLSHGLQPRAMTRDLDWGVKVPLPNTQGKVLYVWFDAPIGYITFTRQFAKANHLNWEKYWKNPDSKIVHFIGKDNIVFHCLIFPAMLMQHGGYTLPQSVPACEFMNLEGEKISTSRNWAIWLHEYLHDFPGKEDVLRYVLAANMPETKDSDFTWNDFATRNNSELVGILGNFVNRTLVLLHKYFEGAVPEVFGDERENTVIVEVDHIIVQIGTSIAQYKFREALMLLMDVARAGNKYMADTEPWKQAANNISKVKIVLNHCVQICAKLAVVMEPFLPFASKKLLHILNMQPTMWNHVFGIMLQPGHKINAPELLFAKIEAAELLPHIEKLKQKKAMQTAKEETNKNNVTPENAVIPEAKQNISYDDFAKLDIRTGTILEAEKVPKTDKLLKLKIDTGIDVRTVVSGIALHHNPEDIVGKQVTILANLAPRTIKGIESKGMILMAEDLNGKLHFIASTDKINNGAEVK